MHSSSSSSTESQQANADAKRVKEPFMRWAGDLLVWVGWQV